MSSIEILAEIEYRIATIRRKRSVIKRSLEGLRKRCELNVQIITLLDLEKWILSEELKEK